MTVNVESTTTRDAMSFRLMGKTVHLSRAALKGASIALALSALSIVATARFHRSPPAKPPSPAGMTVDEQGIQLAQGAPQWNVIKLGKAERGTAHWTEPVAARVRIDERQAARVGSPLTGRVTGVFVELGQRVKKGDPLFAVASPDLATYRNDAAKAKVDLEVAKAQYARVHDMVAQRLLPGKEELTADAEQRQAALQLQLAQAKIGSLRVATRRDNEFTVNSPREGVVVEKSLLPSQEVSTDGTLVQIADVSTVWVVADLFEGDAVGIAEGTPVQITLPSIPGFSAETTVQSMSAVVDPVRHSIPVRVQLPNSDGQLKPNEYADMRFKVALAPNSVEIDASALVSDGATQYVYVELTPGKLSKRKVVAGPERDGKVTVMKGLSAGETVVVQGGILLDNQIELSH
jgi:membrane fusion protein, heavy metal efflux system